MPEPANPAPRISDRETLLSMSGLEFMRGIRDGTLPPAAMAETLGYRLGEVEEGRVTFLGAPAAEHANPMGTVHGGWYGTLLDSAMGCAVMTRVPRGSVYTTLEYKINIIRAIPLGIEVVAEAVTAHAGRSTGVAEGTIRGVADGRLYATGSSTCIIMKLS